MPLLGRIYATARKDRHGLPYAEIGVAQRVVVLSTGERVPLVSNGPTLRATWGWSVRPTFEVTRYHVNAALGRLWIDVFR